MTVNAKQSKSLLVEVTNGGDSVLLGSKIYCPLKRDSCNIKIPNVASSNMLQDMEVHAAESFYDVNITCASADPTYCENARLYCTGSYNQECHLKRFPNSVSQWNCTNKQFCEHYSYSPTSSPIPSTLFPTKEPSDEPTSMPVVVTIAPTSAPSARPYIYI